MAKNRDNIGIRKAIFQEVTFAVSEEVKLKKYLGKYYAWSPEQVDALLASCGVEHNGCVYSVWLPLFSNTQEKEGFEKGDFDGIPLWYKPLRFSFSEFVLEEVIEKLQTFLKYNLESAPDSSICFERSVCEQTDGNTCANATETSDACFGINEDKGEIMNDRTCNVNSCQDKEQSVKKDFRTIINDVITDLNSLKEDFDQTMHVAIDERSRDFETAKQAALNKQKEDFETAKQAALNKQKEELETAKQAALNKQKKEFETAKQAELDTQKRELEAIKLAALDTQRKDFDSKMNVYQSRLILHDNSLQEYAGKLVAFFEACKELTVLASTALNNSSLGINDSDIDNYNYYIVRNYHKYSRSMSKIEDYDSFVKDVSLLAQTGMILHDGLLNRTFFGGGRITTNMVDTLQLLAYKKFIKQMASASIVLGDEYAYLIPAMVASCAENKFKVFADSTEKIRKKVEDLGYTIGYARPNEPVGQKNVDVVAYKRVNGWSSGQILEITELAINFGNSQSKTKVITCE